MAIEQNKQKQVFKADKFLFVELGAVGSDVIMTKLLKRHLGDSSKLETMLKGVLLDQHAPSNARDVPNPVKIPDRKPLPFLCDGDDLEVIFYIDSKVGMFETETSPFAGFDPDFIHDPRLYYVDQNGLQRTDFVPSKAPDSHRQMAAFSYRGRKARDERVTDYSFKFFIALEKTSIKALNFPGSGDIGHPGGNS